MERSIHAIGGRFGLRPLSAALVAAHGCAGLAGLGAGAALVHALWFSMLLTRRGRLLLAIGSISLGLGWLMACATSARSGICLAGFALASCLAAAWLAARGMDELEAFWHGRATEGVVRRKLDRLVRRLNPIGDVRHGVLLRSGDHFTEIDHVVLSAAGVIVIETKGYTGVIDFDPASGAWSRTTKSGFTEAIDDPVRQNLGHLRAVALLFPEVPLTSLVVMPRAILGPDVPRGVVGLEELEALSSWEGIRGGRLDVVRLSAMLAKADQSTAANHRAHLAWMRRIRGERANPVWQIRRIRIAAILYFGVPALVSVAYLTSALRSAFQ